MPITVFQPSGGVWSPGMAFISSSSLLPVDSASVHWTIRGIGGPSEQELFNWSLTSSSNTVSGVVLLPREHPIPAPERGVPSGTLISIEIGAENEVGQTDTTNPNPTFTWDPTMALWSYISNNAGSTGAVGFTDADRTLLNETNQLSAASRAALQSTVVTDTGARLFDLGQLFSWFSPEFWGKTDLSGGTTCERVTFDASHSNLFSVSVILDQVPESILFRTPDNNYAFPDLAVLTFVQAGVIVERHGIHTRSHQVSPLPGTMWYGAVGVNAPIQPADYFIIVDWLEGVCGRLIGAHSPFG